MFLKTMMEMAKTYLLMETHVKPSDLPKLQQIVGRPDLTQAEADAMLQNVVNYLFSLVKL